MKRFSRNGVPLVRRLQRSWIKTSSSTSDGTATGASSSQISLGNHLDQFMMLKNLRCNLERARLLVELAKKREKLKREERMLDQLITLHQTNPFYVLLCMTHDNLIALDKTNIFSRPVKIEEAPDYYQIIKNPMDFQTMREKIDSMSYENLQQFENDLNLIIKNCLTYNIKGDPFYNAGLKLKTQVILSNYM